MLSGLGQVTLNLEETYDCNINYAENSYEGAEVHRGGKLPVIIDISMEIFMIEVYRITVDLTRFAIQAKGPDGKWTRKPLAYRESNNVHLLITRPPEICVNLVFKHIHAASIYTICRQFVPFIYCPL